MTVRTAFLSTRAPCLQTNPQPISGLDGIKRHYGCGEKNKKRILRTAIGLRGTESFT